MDPAVPPGECKLKSLTGTHIDFRFLSDFRDATGTFEKGSVFKETLKNDKWWSECSGRGGKSRVQCVCTYTPKMDQLECHWVPSLKSKRTVRSVLTSYHFIPHHCCATESVYLTVGTDFMEWGFTPENGITQAPAEVLFCTCKPSLHSSRDSREMQLPFLSLSTQPLLAEIMQCPFYCSNVNIYQEKTRKYDLTQED